MQKFFIIFHHEVATERAKWKVVQYGMKLGEGSDRYIYTYIYIESLNCPLSNMEHNSLC